MCYKLFVLRSGIINKAKTDTTTKYYIAIIVWYMMLIYQCPSLRQYDRMLTRIIIKKISLLRRSFLITHQSAVSIA